MYLPTSTPFKDSSEYLPLTVDLRFNLKDPANGPRYCSSKYGYDHLRFTGDCVIITVTSQTSDPRAREHAYAVLLNRIRATACTARGLRTDSYRDSRGYLTRIEVEAVRDRVRFQFA